MLGSWSKQTSAFACLLVKLRVAVVFRIFLQGLAWGFLRYRLAEEVLTARRRAEIPARALSFVERERGFPLRPPFLVIANRVSLSFRALHHTPPPTALSTASFIIAWEIRSDACPIVNVN